MVKHIWSVLCSSSSIDYETSMVSILNVFEHLTLINPPQDKELTIPVAFEMISLWSRDDDDIPCKGKGRISFVDRKKKVTILSEEEVDLTKTQNYRTRVKSRGIRIKEPGKFHFIVELQQDNCDHWESVANIPLYINYVKKSEDEK